MGVPDSLHALRRVARVVDGMPRRGKQALMVAWDAAMAPLCLLLALSLRLGSL
ncbi:MAG: hypothetical protein RI990_1860, partial [Planctomycetota bacterium]